MRLNVTSAWYGDDARIQENTLLQLAKLQCLLCCHGTSAMGDPDEIEKTKLCREDVRLPDRHHSYRRSLCCENPPRLTFTAPPPIRVLHARQRLPRRSFQRESLLAQEMHEVRHPLLDSRRLEDLRRNSLSGVQLHRPPANHQTFRPLWDVRGLPRHSRSVRLAITRCFLGLCLVMGVLSPF